MSAATDSTTRAPGSQRSVQRSFNRFEFKYLVDFDQKRRLEEDLAPYTVRDPYSDPERGYPVYSLYWESPEHTFFWEKIDGQKVRRKLRFRLYEGGETAFVEIKQRIDRTVQKRRTPLPIDEVRALFGRGDIDPELESEVEDRTLREALLLCRMYRLRPETAIRYQRTALFGAHESDLRITFDTRLRYDARAHDLGRPFEVGKSALDPRLSVMEIKFNERVPLWLVRLAGRRGLELVRFSKYCAAVDRECYGSRFSQE